jgi:hypothetical protein
MASPPRGHCTWCTLSDIDFMVCDSVGTLYKSLIIPPSINNLNCLCWFQSYADFSARESNINAFKSCSVSTINAITIILTLLSHTSSVQNENQNIAKSLSLFQQVFCLNDDATSPMLQNMHLLLAIKSSLKIAYACPYPIIMPPQITLTHTKLFHKSIFFSLFITISHYFESSVVFL